MSLFVSLFVLCLAVLIHYSECQKPDIYSLHIQSDVKYRFSTTLVTSRVVNPHNTSTEALFDVFLPNDAFISNFTMEIDGEVYSGDVKEKEKAQKQYQRAKQRGQSAGLISKKPRDANRFKVKINIAAQGKVAFNLTYQELLERKKGFYQHTVFVNPGQVVDDMQIEVAIQESREITSIDATTKVLSNDIYTDYTTAVLAIISQQDPQNALIKYFPSVDEQRQYSDDGFSGQFVVRYDIDRELDAGDILVVNGYFVHFFAPKVEERLPRDVIFVIDSSGSMGGQKTVQVKEALRKILVDLPEGERFNVMTFSSGSHNEKWFKEDLVDVTPASIQEALSFVDSIRAYGGTNILSALVAGLRQLAAKHASDRSLALLFLTDGQGSHGMDKILTTVSSENQAGVAMFALAFGKDADWKLVQKISDENHGFARKIYIDSDASLQIAGFYDEVAVTLMKDVQIKYLDDAVEEGSLTKSDYGNYYEGSELVVAGKLEDDNVKHLNLEVLGNSADGGIVLSTSADDIALDFSDTSGQTTFADFATITEKTWAYLTIKQLLDKAEVTDNSTIQLQMKERALELSLKYNFVTPLTSMVVTKPKDKEEEEDEEDEKEDTSEATPKGSASRPPTLRPKTGGYSGAAGQADSDPHFIVNVKGLENHVCFDVMGDQGDVYQLVKDRTSGLIVNAKVVANKAKPRKAKNDEIKTFLGEINVRRYGFKMMVTPLKIKINGDPMDWTSGTLTSYGNVRIIIDSTNSTVVIQFPDRITLIIMRHLNPKSLLRAGKVHFLGFYIMNFKGISPDVHGLLGQFLYRTVHLKQTKERNGKLMGQLEVSGNIPKPRKLMATLGHRLNLATNQTVPCWMVQHNGGALLDGVVKDYLIVNKQKG